MRRLFRLLTSAAPLLIIGALLYAGLLIKPQPKGSAVQRPTFERGDRLYGLAVQANGKAWLVGSNGKILHTGDGARSWEYEASPVDASLQDIAAWDDRRAVSVGNGGVIIVTADGGKSWRNVEAPRSRIADKLVRVKAIEGGHAWAVGEGGSILHSTDFGSHWTQLGAVEDVAWNDVFVKDGRAWIVGEKGRIRVSSDNGASWREVTGPLKNSLMSVAFKDAKNGVAVGLNGIVLVSYDGGETWLERKPSSPDRPLDDNRAGSYLERVKANEEPAKAYERGRLEHLFCVIWDGTRWVAAGSKGIIVIGSADGKDWRGTRLFPQDRDWYTTIGKDEAQYYLSGARFTTKPIKDL